VSSAAPRVVPTRRGWLARLPNRMAALPGAGLAVAAGLYAVAAGFALAAAASLSFPLTEGSAYYVAVAENLVSGHGLVINAIWSYAAPPLTLPRPAFELWQPLATFIAALPMSVLGPTFAAAQLGYVLLGALLAPLAWLVGRDAARRLRLPADRASALAIGSGLLAAVGGPFLLAVAAPDSTLPFTILTVTACLAMPAAIDGDRRAVVALGVLLGLAYLARQEAVYVGLAFVLLAAGSGARWTSWLARVSSVAVVGALVAAPWWLRNAAVFGTPFSGQVADNLLFVRNEQVFAYLERPSLANFLAQGPGGILGNIAVALWHDLVDVLAVPGGPAIAVGLLTALAALAVIVRRRYVRHHALWASPLVALMLGGGLIYVATSVLFPVATLWGTFEHAAGPLFVGLSVSAAAGTDRVVAWVRRRRGWPRTNAWLAPLTLVALTLPLAGLQVAIAAGQTRDEASRMAAAASALPASLADAGVAMDTPLISDQPIWLSDALDRPAIALPDEPPTAVARLAADFGAQALVVFDGRGRYPDVLRQAGGSPCFAERPVPGGVAVSLFIVEPECLQ
jgi:hypothetical protein